MVNHVRTLLLNERGPRPDGIYVPPAFTPVPVPAKFTGLRDILVPQDRDAAGKSAAVAALLKCCSTPELYPYLTRFDSRITYTEQDADISALCGADAATASELTALVQRMEHFPVAVFMPLFTWPRYLTDLSLLRLVAADNNDGVLSLGAIALAYAYQLERVRVGD